MSNHTCIYKANGELHVFGYNESGQLGLGDFQNRNVPTLLMTNKNIKKIYCSGYHTLIHIKSTGELYVFGNNRYGQLGLGDFQNRNVPTLLMTDKNIKSVHCGEDFTLIYKTTGELYGFGRNSSYELGLGDDIHRNIPTLLMIDRSIKNIRCGAAHTLIHKLDGKLYCYGHNGYGQLGLGDNINRFTPILLMTDKSIKSIHCGALHNFIYKLDDNGNGKLYGFGYNIRGQLGLGDHHDRNIPTLVMTDKNIKSIHCGDFHTIIHKNDEKLYVFGNNRLYVRQITLLFIKIMANCMVLVIMITFDN
jgi:alpha-tubulin suppressor-like RCC1 family protein